MRVYRRVPVSVRDGATGAGAHAVWHRHTQHRRKPAVDAASTGPRQVQHVFCTLPHTGQVSRPGGL